VSTWSNNWKKSNEVFFKKNPEVRAVLERRKVGGGTLYCVGLKKGGFEVRKYSGDGKVVVKKSYSTGAKAVLAYRELRDTLCPNRGGIAVTRSGMGTSRKKAVN
jgi:hypothetical protein